MNHLPKLLLIEDNRSMAAALQQALQTIYSFELATTGKQGLYCADRESFDAIILDLNLPDISGRVVCQQLRERGVTAPILVVSGEQQVMSKITLLDAGANDYVTKPFSLGELKARLRNLLRQHDISIPRSSRLTYGDLELNSITHEVSRAGTAMQLRRKELAVLECLMAYQGAVVSRQMLINHAWHGSDENWTNTIDVHIKHLRDKVDKSFDFKMIRTVHGIGYRLDKPKLPTPSPYKDSIALQKV